MSSVAKRRQGNGFTHDPYSTAMRRVFRQSVDTVSSPANPVSSWLGCLVLFQLADGSTRLSAESLERTRCGSSGLPPNKQCNVLTQDGLPVLTCAATSGLPLSFNCFLFATGGRRCSHGAIDPRTTAGYWSLWPLWEVGEDPPPSLPGPAWRRI